MFLKNEEVAPPDQYFADSLLTPPTLKQSVYHNLAADFVSPIAAINNLFDEEYAKKPEGQNLYTTLDAIQLENETPGTPLSTKIAGHIAGMIGSGLSPPSLPLGAAGGAAGRLVVPTIERALPEGAMIFTRTPLAKLIKHPAIAKHIPETYGAAANAPELTVNLLGKKVFGTFGEFAGAGIPQSIVDNYNRDNGHITWGGVAREAGEMGAFGLAIGSIPFAWGVIRGKANRGLGRASGASLATDELDEALSKGIISKAEHQWDRDLETYEKDPSNETLKTQLEKDGSIIAEKNGHTVNHVNNEALFHILEPQDIENLKGAISDEVIANAPEQLRSSLINFTLHHPLDRISSHANDLDGIRGYVDFINKKLEIKTQKLAQLDKILNEHLSKGLRENMEFSQKSLLKMLKTEVPGEFHVEHFPMVIPKNVKRHIQQLQKLSKLKSKAPNKAVQRRIKQLEANLAPIHSPKAELEVLRKELSGKDMGAGMMEISEPYNRLKELAMVWRNARDLLDRIDLEREYTRQEAFRDLANQVLRTVDADLEQIAKPENVIDYLKSRLEGIKEKVKTPEEINKTIEEAQSVPSDVDTILNEEELRAKSSSAEDAKEQFIQSNNKYKEFKESPHVFKNLLSCVRGTLNG